LLIAPYVVGGVKATRMIDNNKVLMLLNDQYVVLIFSVFSF